MREIFTKLVQGATPVVGEHEAVEITTALTNCRQEAGPWQELADDRQAINSYIHFTLAGCGDESIKMRRNLNCEDSEDYWLNVLTQEVYPSIKERLNG